MKILSLLLLLGGCGASTASLGSLRNDLEAGATLAATSTVALSSSTVDIATCASAATKCTAYPCTANVNITVGPGCPLPLGTATGDTVQAIASLSTADAATIASTFVGSAVVVVNATNISVSRSGNTTTVTYVGQDVNTAGGTLAAQSSWTVLVDSQGTPDPSDDTFTLSGDSQASGTTVDQVTIADAVMDPTCRLNPISGTATIQHVSLTSIQQDAVTFHAACDGKVDVGGASIGLGIH